MEHVAEWVSEVDLVLPADKILKGFTIALELLKAACLQSRTISAQVSSCF